MTKSSNISGSQTNVLDQFIATTRELLAGDDPDRFATGIRMFFETNPEIVDLLFPGMRLVLRPLTPKERGRIAIAAANAERQRKRRQHLATVIPAIRRLRAENSAISLREIGERLDKQNIPPVRAKKWTARSVQLVLKEMEDANQSHETGIRD